MGPFHRPAITLAQAVSGVPIIANLLAAWGVFTPTAAQQSTMTDLLTWSFALLGADAAIRVGRNVSDGLKAKAAPVPPFVITSSSGGVVPTPPEST